MRAQHSSSPLLVTPLSLTTSSHSFLLFARCSDFDLEEVDVQAGQLIPPPLDVLVVLERGNSVGMLDPSVVCLPFESGSSPCSGRGYRGGDKRRRRSSCRRQDTWSWRACARKTQGRLRTPLSTPCIARHRSHWAISRHLYLTPHNPASLATTSSISSLATGSKSLTSTAHACSKRMNAAGSSSGGRRLDPTSFMRSSRQITLV